MNELIAYDTTDEKIEPMSSTDDNKVEKKRLRRLKRNLETVRLDPWERYRILTDQMRQYIDLVELADRKTHFALVLLGAMNAINLIVLVRAGVSLEAGSLLGPGMALYLTAYVGVSLFLCSQAIRELKPRIWGKTKDLGVPLQEMLGLRFIGDAAETARAEYYQRWQKVQFGQVNREIAYNIQLIAQTLTVKYKALDRLYNGLLLLVIFTAVILSILIYGHSWL